MGETREACSNFYPIDFSSEKNSVPLAVGASLGLER